MAKQNTSSTPAQGGGSAENQNNLLSNFERSELNEARNEALNDAQSTDQNSPNYVEAKVEETQKVEQDQFATLLEAQTPEWVQTILDSNQSVLDSNQQVIDALEELKAFADERSTGPAQSHEPKVQLIDEDEEYEVASGQSFRDPLDFTKEYTEGDDVTHLGVIKLQSLLNAGLIVESE